MDRIDGKPADRVEVTGDLDAWETPERVAAIEKLEKLLVAGPARPYHPEYDALKGRGAKP